ncbi:MAG: hypothetical protein LBF16_01030 [Pseudomonadales bacterium]|jgi:hypothetical protein|nr:hypothetical protein [Pseudomonadales bacterium]
MAKSPRESNTQIIIALIGAVVAIATALIAQGGDSGGEGSPICADCSPPPDRLTGTWHDDEGYTYLIQQNGTQFQYRMMQGGNEQGSGSGNIDAQGLHYSYDAGAGSCDAILSNDNTTITGTCKDAATGESWPFQLQKAVVAIATGPIAQGGDSGGGGSQGCTADCSPPDRLTGTWHDDEGYTFLFQQNGTQFQYRMMQGGNEQGSGSGNIDEQTLHYSYDAGAGNCDAVLGNNNKTIIGTCKDAATGESWPFQLQKTNP